MHSHILIPARGGSKAIPRKALRRLGGKPLVLHALQEMAGAFGSDRVVLSTDDDEIAHVCGDLARVLRRPPALAGDEITLDEVARSVVDVLLAEGAAETDALVTVQPTSPFVRAGSVHRALALLADGARSVVSVRDDRHLRWTCGPDGKPQPLFERRVNRQWLPPTLTETGGIIAARLGDVAATGSRIVPPVALLALEGDEAIDIDGVADWLAAEAVVARRTIVIRADAGRDIGMGHVYRALALAHELLGHDVTLVTASAPGRELGTELFARSAYRARVVHGESAFLRLLEEVRPDVTIVDVLDTDADAMRAVKRLGGFVVTFENLGAGAELADLVINDLYSHPSPKPRHWFGLDVSILAAPFETVTPREEQSPRVEKVLVTFGGTDPNDLTPKALQALALAGYEGEVTVVLGPGNRNPGVDVVAHGLRGRVLRGVDNMALLMRESDLALTSAGRTVTELMTMGVPTVVLCQNVRELWHTHASPEFGVVNLGLGAHAVPAAVAAHVALLLADRALRAEMRQRALAAVRNRSNAAIARRLLAAAASARP